MILNKGKRYRVDFLFTIKTAHWKNKLFSIYWITKYE